MSMGEQLHKLQCLRPFRLDSILSSYLKQVYDILRHCSSSDLALTLCLSSFQIMIMTFLDSKRAKGNSCVLVSGFR